MKKIITFLIFATMLLIFASCSGTRKPYCPTYAMEVQFDTLIAVNGDTTYHRIPYKMNTFEKTGLGVAIAISLWAVSYSE